jgi:signal transduction histidine kinase
VTVAPDPAPVLGSRARPWPRRWFRTPRRWDRSPRHWFRTPRYWFQPPRRWFRTPRRTVRLRLTLVYSALFLVLGAALLAITYLLVSKSLPAGPITAGASATAPSATAPSAPASSAPAPPSAAVFFRSRTGSCHLSAPLVGPPGQLQAQAQRCLSEQRAAELRQLLTESGIALAIMAVVSIGLGWLVAGRMLGKLRTITAAARSVSARNLHARLAMAGPEDELKELGDTFDGLLARLEAAFGAQRQFVANASHELRTPLARQRTLIEVALADPEPSIASLRDVCQRLLVTGEEQERLIEALLTLARSQRGLDRRAPVELASIADRALRAQWPEAESRGLTVTASLQSAPALGDVPLAERLVTNLVENAVRHNVPRGAVDVSTGTWAGRAILSVFSSGAPIPPDQVDRLFQPFQRGVSRDRTGGRDGLGLGLSIVTAIAEAHGAWVQAHALPDGGLGIRVGFPLAAPAAPPGSSGQVQAPPARQAPPGHEEPPGHEPPHGHEEPPGHEPQPGHQALPDHQAPSVKSGAAAK